MSYYMGFMEKKADKSFVCSFWGDTKRAFVGSVTLLIFGLAIMAMSVMTIFTPSVAYPAETMVVLPTQVSTASAQPLKSEYYLPYPGVLPDSPFYKLKAARDRIVLWLTFDMEKKAWRQIGYADKRVNAARFLLEGGKSDLAVSTVSKAEKYLGQAFVIAESQTKAGRDVKSLLLTLSKSIDKHGEILEDMTTKTSGPQRSMVEDLIKLNKLLSERTAQVLREAK